MSVGSFRWKIYSIYTLGWPAISRRDLELAPLHTNSVYRPVPTSQQGLKKATKTIGDVAQELERSKAVHARSQEEHARYVATAVQKANHAAKLSAEADLDTARRREESLIGRLRETEKAAASERVRMDRELDEVREACEQLRARATAAEDKARGESERGKAKLAELIAQKDEMVRGGSNYIGW